MQSFIFVKNFKGFSMNISIIIDRTIVRWQKCLIDLLVLEHTICIYDVVRDRKYIIDNFEQNKSFENPFRSIGVKYNFSKLVDLNDIEECDYIINFTMCLQSIDLIKFSTYGVIICGNMDNSPTLQWNKYFWDTFDDLNFISKAEIILYKNETEKYNLVYKYSTKKDSILRTLYIAYWKYPYMVLDLLKSKYLSIDIINEENIFINKPSKWNKFIYFYKILRRKFKKLRYKVVNIAQWILFYKIDNEIYTVIPPKDRIYADPFLFNYQEEVYVFFEEMTHKEGMGFISCGKIVNNNFQYMGKVLETDFHMSFPFVFRNDDKIYMIPESSQSMKLSIYECTKFPLEWTKKIDLLNEGFMYDSVIFKYKNIFWLFTTIKRAFLSDSADELHLYFNEDLISTEWKSHPQNPIVTDVSNARMAGSIYIKDDKIIRPSQDCSRTYGEKIHLNEILILTKIEYREKLLDTISEENFSLNIRNVHTMNRIKNIQVYDAIQDIFRW